MFFSLTQKKQSWRLDPNRSYSSKYPKFPPQNCHNAEKTLHAEKGIDNVMKYSYTDHGFIWKFCKKTVTVIIFYVKGDVS